MTASVRDQAWKQFILEYGWRARKNELAAVVGRTAEEVVAARLAGCVPRKTPLRFADLFAAWHGRAPEDEDWPIPWMYASGRYHWLPNEDALLATLVGQVGIAEIVETLNQRLRKITGDRTASRSLAAVQIRIIALGLKASDVVGGITIADAARDIGSRAIIDHAIRIGTLATRRVGKLHVISRDAWAVWKASRAVPPANTVKLSSIRQALGIRSDGKLPEFAKCGYVPSARLHCADANVGRGEWYIDEVVAKQLVEDRRAGRPMPWHGKPLEINLKQTYRLWCSRRHPASCETCTQIWGAGGVPPSFEDYEKRYPPLAHGAKRHLTREWDPGLTLREVTRLAICSDQRIQDAVDSGALTATQVDGVLRVTRTNAARWIARRCPDGSSLKSWLSLESAQDIYKFSLEELQGFIKDGRLRHKIGDAGAMRGGSYVLKQQCAELRQAFGFTHEECAKRAGIPVDRFRELLATVHWRQEGLVPLLTLQAVIKRLKSSEGVTVDEAAAELNVSLEWIRDRIEEGTVRVKTSRWNPERVYLTAPMLERLRRASKSPAPAHVVLGADWISTAAAATLCGVSIATVTKWVTLGLLASIETPRGQRFHVDALKGAAREYWKTCRFRRATRPDWLLAEQGHESFKGAPDVTQ